MQAVRIKICGITRIEDALAAAELGADAIGLVFYQRSPRRVTIEQAGEIIGALPPFITTVGLFVDAAAHEVEHVLAQLPLDLLQFHGDEPADYCEAFARPYIKALRMRPGLMLAQAAGEYATARGILLDTYVEGVPGGTGQAFTWSAVPDDVKMPIILAGGLNAVNVAEAITTVRPWAVDVSGGVETARGIKDVALMTAFVEAVNTAVRSLPETR
jgi:phosphoribosylanthranilate isomerase